MPVPTSTSYVRQQNQSGTYVGTGTTSFIVTGFEPSFIEITDDENDYLTRKYKADTKTKGFGRNAVGSALLRPLTLTSGGITIQPTGFIVGSNPGINKSEVLYFWKAQP